MSGELGWDDLATAALLGTARRELRVDDLPAPLAEAAVRASPAEDPAARLLQVAALGTLYRRAGIRPAAARPRPEPAPADQRPAVGRAASARLDMLLGTAEPELLELWLRTAAERGLRPPERVLPLLLDQAARSRVLAPVIAAAVGPRGHWLAGHRKPWAAAMAPHLPPTPHLSATSPDTQPLAATSYPAPVADPDDPEGWQLGSPEQRRRWLAALRRNDSDAARELLAAGWAKEVPAERPALLAVLEDGLSAADEPFLEVALADRRTDVRAAAARTLSLLPESAYGRRAADRALAAVQRESRLLRTRLVVLPPTEHDAGMARDQVPAPPTGRQQAGSPTTGPGAWLLLHVVAAAPLRSWLPGLGRTPAEIAALDVADGWRPTLWEGWARAAVRERDAEWAAALLTDPPQQPTRDPRDEVRAIGALLDLLPSVDRAGPVARLVTERGAAALPVLGALSGPWPDPVARAVVRWLVGQRGGSHEVRPVLELAGRRLPVELAEPIREAAMDWPLDSPWRSLFRQTADLITFRRELLEELQ